MENCIHLNAMDKYWAHRYKYIQAIENTLYLAKLIEIFYSSQCDEFTISGTSFEIPTIPKRQFQNQILFHVNMLRGTLLCQHIEGAFSCQHVKGHIFMSMCRGGGGAFSCQHVKGHTFIPTY